VRVELAEASHDILVGQGLLDRAGELLQQAGLAPGNVAVVTDENVGPLHAPRLLGSLEGSGYDAVVHTLPAGEETKSLDTIRGIYEFLLTAGIERGRPLMALGGGVVGDAAGFAAATWLRGIPLVQAGTSLLAQVDSSIGGKVGINLPRGKNLAGAFHQPRLVVSDVTTLETLDDDEFRSGLAEVVKYGVIRDGALFARLEVDHEKILARDVATLTDIIEACSRIKSKVVAGDEREGGARKILNFGHTVGHALEAVRGYGVLRHGEAVAIGMMAAARLGRDLALTDPILLQRLEKLLVRLGLPIRAPFRAEVEELTSLMARDKKVEKGNLVFVLVRALGQVEIVRDVDPARLSSVLESVAG
jgi:3-dehydroquinate synthase